MTKDLPKVAFMPIFDNFGDCLPLIEVAKKYKELGGEAVFIGLEGIYQHKPKESGLKVITIKKTSLVKNIDHIKDKSNYLLLSDGRALDKNKSDELNQEQIYKNLYNKESRDYYRKKINQEIKIFKKEKIGLVFAAYNFTTAISARHLKLPLIILLSGVATPQYFESNYATFPENYENILTRLIPSSIKKRFVNWYILNCKWGVKGFNKLADEYNAPHINRFLDLTQGDYTLIADDPNFLKIKPNQDITKKNFVGPLLPKDEPREKNNETDEKIKKHLKRNGKSILFTLGSSGSNLVYKEILKALNDTKYNVISPYNMVVKKEELPVLDNNILAVEYVPSIKQLHKKTDMAIIHGGRGTVYTSAYAGKPAVGIPMHSEQQHNLDNLVRHGSCIQISKKYFSQKKLLNAVEKIFDNYEIYLQNAKKLRDKLDEPKGAERAAKRIMQISKYQTN